MLPAVDPAPLLEPEYVEPGVLLGLVPDPPLPAIDDPLVPLIDPMPTEVELPLLIVPAEPVLVPTPLPEPIVLLELLPGVDVLLGVVLLLRLPLLPPALLPE